LKRARQSKGSPGTDDGMTVDELPTYLVDHWCPYMQVPATQTLGGRQVPQPTGIIGTGHWQDG
jgi:hypothetical protein